MEIFLASLAVLSGWLVFRSNMISEYKKIIVSLNSLLDVAGYWFESSYPEDLDKAE